MNSSSSGRSTAAATTSSETLRARGWSIQSEGTMQSNHSEGQFADAGAMQSSRSEDQFADADADPHERMSPCADRFGDPPSPAEAKRETATAAPSEQLLLQQPALSSVSKRKREDDYLYDSMNEEEPDENEKKKSTTTNILDVAKSRLSKWAARLFDPNRPRGLIEPPQTIPLNDEFLQAFGKRVKQDDAMRGIAHELPETAIAEEGEGSTAAAASSSRVAAPAAASKSDRKLKLVNLKFTTTEDTLLQACQHFGEVEEINLIMDDDNARLNKGRAFVTFGSSEAAQACIDGLETLDGRPLRVFLVNAESKQPGGGPGGSRGTSGGMSRYWLADLGTKCYRCGQVGHTEKDCPNEAAAKPCPLCAQTTHDLRDCPSKSCCFNCGLVGHLNRDCPYSRGSMPRRVVCTLCCLSGHHKLQCRNNNNNGHGKIHPAAAQAATQAAAASAVCMVCGKTGHYSCRDNKWFFGFDHLTCYNCGRVGHSGFDCDRPRFEVCSRHEQVAAQEIERAATWSTAEEHIAERLMQMQQEQERQQQFQQQQQRGDRDRGRSNVPRGQQHGYNHNKPQHDLRRAKSMPPPRINHTNNNYRGGGVGDEDNDGSRRRDRRDSSDRDRGGGGSRNTPQRIDRGLSSQRQKQQQPPPRAQHQSSNGSNNNKRSRWR